MGGEGTCACHGEENKGLCAPPRRGSHEVRRSTAPGPEASSHATLPVPASVRGPLVLPHPPFLPIARFAWQLGMQGLLALIQSRCAPVRSADGLRSGLA
jgi:hypothetical protein